MYVKILNGKEETLIECDAVNCRKPDDRDDVFFLTAGDQKRVTVEWEINRYKMEVFIMNDNGKTIESYHRWPIANEAA